MLELKLVQHALIVAVLTFNVIACTERMIRCHYVCLGPASVG